MVEFTDGSVLAQWGTSGSGVGQFNAPFGVAVDGSNTVFVVDQLNNRVQRFQADGTALHFLDCFRRFHLFLRAERETILAAWSHSGGAQTIEHFRFIRQLAVVALMDGKRHVNEGTRHKHNYRRQQDG